VEGIQGQCGWNCQEGKIDRAAKLSFQIHWEHFIQALASGLELGFLRGFYRGSQLGFIIAPAKLAGSITMYPRGRFLYSTSHSCLTVGLLYSCQWDVRGGVIVVVE
jgi:hypothetical protein